MPTVPTQEKTLDPFSSNRYSSSYNKFSRVITRGVDCILFNDISLPITRTDDTTITVGSGLCVKDDVVIHITQDDYQVDMTNWNFYIDANTGGNPMDSTGYYYIVVSYAYKRSIPSPKAYFRIIKDADTYYVPYMTFYIFLGAVSVIYSEGNYILASDPNCVYRYDPADPLIRRPLPPADAFLIDGGEIV